ncbi:MAG TPA: hypothetical protein VGC36_07805 [Rhizomicrobium sp.]
MTLANDVKALLQRRLPVWDPLLRSVGLAVDPANLAALRDPLPHIYRTVPGFEDFSELATRAIEPGDPALSLLYHAFASPNVRPAIAGGQPSDADFLTLAELDLLENYIYSLAPAPANLADLVVAVFAYEYRPAVSTSHQLHADLLFSRTGVARVGSTPPAWSAPFRCFLNQAPGHPDTFAAMPARYAAFLAEKRVADTDNISLVGKWDDDVGRRFLFPVRKLFDGPECLPGAGLTLSFREYHRSEKLQRIFTVGKIKPRAGFDLGAPPFLRQSGDAEPLATLSRAGASVLVSSPPVPLVRYARQRNAASGHDEYVGFTVPPAGPMFNDFSENRHYTTLMLVESWWTLAPEIIIGELTDAHPRIAPRNLPNFVNIRHEVRDPLAPPVDLGAQGAITDGRSLEDYVKDGGYQAAMFEDGICDGALKAEVAGLPVALASHAAFSVVTAPDFFPFADELHLSNHTQATPGQFKAGGPAPLCEGRYPVNPAVLKALSGGHAAEVDDKTLVAIVGRPRHRAASVQPPRERGIVRGKWSRTTSYLTDAASNVFAPGWDVTFCGGLFDKFYATYGLGSPFPEDVKLCAAANSFWPAAAPDASRTFQRTATPTAIPMLDEELGYHAKNPDKPVGAGTRPGWDGEYGPFFEYVNRERVVNFSDIRRSDYVRNALLGTFRPDPLINVGSDELIARMDCLRLCIKSLPPSPKDVSNTKLWLITAQRVPDWTAVPEHHSLTGAGYKFVFVKPTGDKPVRVPDDSRRMRQRIEPVGYICHVTPTKLFWSTDGRTFVSNAA